MAEDSNDVRVIFRKIDIPELTDTLSSDTEKMPYGNGDDYGIFLLNLYGDSAIHSAIINGKANYIQGAGIKNGAGQDIQGQFNGADLFPEFASKIIKDYEIFNFYAIHVRYNVFGQPSSYDWIPAQRVRTNANKDIFWVCKNWKTKQNQNEKYYRYVPKPQKGSVIGDDLLANGGIFFFDGYFPAEDSTYPKPSYHGGIKAISSDIAIRDFNLNTISSEFSGTTVVSFYRGSSLTKEQKEEVTQKLKKKYTGQNGDRLIVDFIDPEGKKADIDQLSPQGWADAYTPLSEKVSQDIFVAHEITSPALFGIKTEGQLGNTTELESAYEIFKNSYIEVKRTELLMSFRLLFSGNDVLGKGGFQFTDKPLFKAEVSDEIKILTTTVDESRKDQGRAPMGGTIGNMLLCEVQSNNTTPVQLVQQDPKKKVKEEVKANPNDFNLDGIGLSKDDFEEVTPGRFHFDADSNLIEKVITFLLQNRNRLNNKNIGDVIRALNDQDIQITATELIDIISDMVKTGLINVGIKDKKVSIEAPKTKVPDGKNVVYTAYDFVKRDGVEGAAIIPTSSDMCKLVYNSKKYYTLKDIQGFSDIMGFDVLAHGFHIWRDKETGKVLDHCRHGWRQVILRKKLNS